jgi:hypothetical protein
LMMLPWFKDLELEIWAFTIIAPIPAWCIIFSTRAISAGFPT